MPIYIDSGEQPGRPAWDRAEGLDFPKEVREAIIGAHAAAAEGRAEEAERLFRKALEWEYIPTLANNLALLQLERYNNPAEALRFLERNLTEPTTPWQPFAQSVAARSHALLGQLDQARRALDQAIHDFEAGMRELVTFTPDQRQAWREYTSKIIQAAGVVGDHHLAWELYERWIHHHVLSSSHFHGGIAAYNIEKYRSARAAWRRAKGSAREEPWAFVVVYEDLARFTEQGLVEPFPLEYDPTMPEPPRLVPRQFTRGDVSSVQSNGRVSGNGHQFGNDRASGSGRMFGNGRMSGNGYAAHKGQASRADRPGDNGEAVAESGRWFSPTQALPYIASYMSRPANRAFLTTEALRLTIRRDGEPATREGALSLLGYVVAAGGEWGVALAQRLLQAPKTWPEMKEVVVQGLVLRGWLRRDDTVEVWVDGAVRERPVQDGLLRWEETTP